MVYLELVIQMSFDGIFLNKLTKELECIKSGRITKIMESGDTDFVLTIRADKVNYHVLISLSCDFTRIHFTTKSYDFPNVPKSFTMFLRKHIEGFFIEDLYQYGNDRILVFKLAGYNEMKDFSHKFLICELMGRYANLILTNEDYQILEVLKKAGVSEFGRTMLPNAIYQFPLETKLNPFSLTLEEMLFLPIASPKELCQKFEGVSMSLACYAFSKEQAIPYFYELLHQEVSPSIYIQKGKSDYYYLSLGNLIATHSSLSELLESFYYDRDNQAKIKAKTNDLEHFIEKQIAKNEKKIKKLTIEAIEAAHAEDYKIKGELLLSYPHLKDKESQIEVFDYYKNESVVIQLDPKYDIITNSQKFYKKYQKIKTAIYYIEEQLKVARNEIEYFQVLLDQLKCASIKDALEIQQELIDHRYMLEDKEKNKKKARPNYLTYIVGETLLYVGKNNLQNEYVTHKLAKGSDYWFHVQKASGSHVIVATNVLTEELCRTAAMLAAKFSSLSDSSSIPVDYTQVKHIKKIPGKRNCFVTYTRQKTIYIDIDEAKLNQLRVKK